VGTVFTVVFEEDVMGVLPDVLEELELEEPLEIVVFGDELTLLEEMLEELLEEPFEMVVPGDELLEELLEEMVEPLDLETVTGLSSSFSTLRNKPEVHSKRRIENRAMKMARIFEDLRER